MIRLLLCTLTAIQLGLSCLTARQVLAQQVAPPAPGGAERVEVLQPHVPLMIWSDDSAALQALREAQQAATEPAQQVEAAPPEAETVVIEVAPVPGSDQQGFSFRDVTDRSRPQPDALPMAERSRAVQEYRRGLIGKNKTGGGAQ